MFGIYGGADFGARGRGRLAALHDSQKSEDQFSTKFMNFRKICQNKLQIRNHILFDAMYQETNTATAGHDADGL
jgi:hypothetical protein